MKSAAARGCAQGVTVGALLAASFVDLRIAYDTYFPLWGPATVLGVGLAALLWPAARRPVWLSPQLRVAVPALVSLLWTAASVLRHRNAAFGPGEIAVLLCLLFMAVRHCPPRWALVCGLLDAVAILVTPARYFLTLWSGDEASTYVVVGLVLAGGTAGFAAYLRSLDYRRTVAVAETRREERVTIAADLHDFVAHHVTGILVQTQMARMMADSRPDEIDPVLERIERAATEALASMRRTVGVLRDSDEAAADRRPVGDLAAISEQAESFRSPLQKVTVHRDPAVSDDLPHEVQAAAFRVVQEALTNVRRHAADSEEIDVRLEPDAGRLKVTVTDDGRGGRSLPVEAHGGGFGLVGLKERVTALGGELYAGPRDGPGWEVQAWFPLDGA